MEPFVDRTEAGRRLADRVRALSLAEPIVLALPRGGVPVAVEVARALSAPMDLLIVRKVGAPFQPELALGALAEARAASPVESRHGSRQGLPFDPVASPCLGRLDTAMSAQDAGRTAVLFIDEDACRQHGVSHTVVEREAQAQRLELARRVALYRAGRSPLPLRGRTAVVVDDGAATGATVRAALMALAPCGLRSTVVAVPVAPADTVRELARLCDRLVCLMQPQPFVAVGLHYRQFAQVSDEEVVAMMRVTGPDAPPTPKPGPTE